MLCSVARPRNCGLSYSGRCCCYCYGGRCVLVVVGGGVAAVAVVVAVVVVLRHLWPRARASRALAQCRELCDQLYPALGRHAANGVVQLVRIPQQIVVLARALGQVRGTRDGHAATVVVALELAVDVVRRTGSIDGAHAGVRVVPPARRRPQYGTRAWAASGAAAVVAAVVTTTTTSDDYNNAQSGRIRVQQRPSKRERRTHHIDLQRCRAPRRRIASDHRRPRLRQSTR